MGVRILGLGHAEASRVVTNDDLAALLDTSDEWIRSRSGIRERRIAGAGQSTATLAADAGRRALKHAGVDDVDVTIVATVTPEQPIPATGAFVQAELDLGGGAYDLNAACAGWVYALITASGLIEVEAAHRVLVIGADTMSTITDPEDRTTAVLFGDAAGAAVLEAVPGRGEIVGADLGCDGRLAHLLEVPAGGSRRPTSETTVAARGHYLKMAGREVFRAATQAIERTCRASLATARLSCADVDVFVPHQANERIVAYAGERLGIPTARTVMNIERCGNTSSASVPVALSEAWEAGRLRPGDHVLVAGFGAGMTWASAVLEWGLAA